ncbi:MAG: alcohol dehydrogenase [Synergistaceae bacterium]|jgi:ribosomal protein S27AE|nr:alcohol dehydrogenase [Synergistaceae bacterium]
MLIVGCQNCGEAKVLAGAPDSDGVARVQWTCPHCGTGQVLQLDVSGDAGGGDLHRILAGLALMESGEEDAAAPRRAAGGQRGFFGGPLL